MSKNGHEHDLARYTAGFIISLLVTIVAFYAVHEKILSGGALALLLAGLAVIQLYVQLVLFLHLGREKSPRWNLVAFGFMTLIVFIVVAGSLWIMANLDGYHGHTEDVDSLIMEKENIYRER